MKAIAHIHIDYKTKFGIPRQSGLVPVQGKILFEPEYRYPEAIRGIEEYSHLWLLWEFSENKDIPWKPTVRPPRLGGNVRVGVYATRSPFRPNPIGLSCVKLIKAEITEEGPVLIVEGADLMDGTPIYDIKPYLPYVDAHPEAKGSFSEKKKDYRLTVAFATEAEKNISSEEKGILEKVLSGDPRPAYQEDEERVYGFEFGNHHIKFRVKEDTLQVIEIKDLK